MPEYLVGIGFHEPEPLMQWNRGLIEDYECSTGLFVGADTPEAAIQWGERVAEALLRHLNNDENLNWKEFGYCCWIENSPSSSGWRHCLDFFQHVRVGEMPALERMGTAAYDRWRKERWA